MEKKEVKRVNREEITSIIRNTFEESDIVATVGTYLSCASSAFEHGFEDYRIRYVVNKGEVVSMCGYGKKYNNFDNECNMVISIPKEFLMELLRKDEQQYREFISDMDIDLDKVKVIMGLSEFSVDRRDSYDYDYDTVLPKEFVKGAYVFDDNVKLAEYSKDPDVSLDHVSYIENPNFYTNLSPEQKENFVIEMRDRIERGNGWIETNSLRRHL